MTSDRTDEQILKDPSGQPSVEQNVGSIGGPGRLNEAPQYGRVVSCVNGKLKSAAITHEHVSVYRETRIHWTDIRPGDFVAGRDGRLWEVVELRDGQPG